MGNLFDNRPRGIRNNNLLNIKYSPRSKWQGLVGNDGTFCIFKTPDYGIRAANKILHNYLKSDSNLDIEHMIKKWCPDSTANSYVSNVCRFTGLSPWTLLRSVFDNFSLYIDLIVSMAFVECGGTNLCDAFGCRSKLDSIVKRGLSMKI